MYIYLIKRTDNVGYDEYEGAVITAQNENEAWEIAKKELFPCFVENRKNVEIELVGNALDTQQRGVLLGDFNAG